MVGTLRPTGRRPDAPIAFTYDSAWAEEPGSFVVDPSHVVPRGDHYAQQGKIAGIFADTSPDRWGRMLLDYRELERARNEARAARSLGEWDYLLGVNDALRMGGLRFGSDIEGPFLDDDPLSVPPAADLRDLEHAARVIEGPSTGRGREEELRLALRHLLAPGSPLGGARPKTTFQVSGELWLAKFPAHNDRRDVGGWEFVLNRLAERAGIAVPTVNTRVFVGPYHTFLARRFDRVRTERRLFASAMTLVGRRDGDDSSYIEIAEAIAAHGAPGTIAEDLAQLFRRLVFNVFVGHRDDHLRNHGFLRTPAGWRLAPAYDLNPMPDRSLHEIAVGLDTREPDIDAVISETAPFCRITPGQATVIVDEVRTTVGTWREVARSVNLSSTEIDLVAPAFVS